MVTVDTAIAHLAGALGNAVNAWGYSIHHNSIGFSTAVFGAIGILGGLTYVSAVRGTTRRPAGTAIAGTLAWTRDPFDRLIAVGFGPDKPSVDPTRCFHTDPIATGCPT